jgi:MFS transporter, SP family, galactose:H+ symporter
MPMQASNTTYNKKLVYFICAVAATGGLLFGFDTGVISGALLFIRDEWTLTSGQQEWLTSSVLLGAMLGAAFSGNLTDRLGRKTIIIIAAVIFSLGAIETSMAPNITWLIAGRIVIGLAIGIASYVVPLYISEISPARIRGALVSLNQLLITVGILVSYLTDMAFADTANGWRWMFLVGLFPALILFIGMFMLPETPRWLYFKGNQDKALKILSKIEDPALINGSVSKMEEDLQLEKKTKSTWSDLLKPKYRLILVIGIILMFVMQATGIGTIIYYAPLIFEISGFGSNEASIGITIYVGIVNVLFTIISISLIDRLGRKVLYNIGLGGMIVALVALGVVFCFQAFLGETLKWFAVGGLLVYVAFFAVSLGPIGWLMISEIYPLNIRGRAMSVSGLANWLSNGVVAFTFLKMSRLLTLPGKEVILNDGSRVSNPAGVFFVYAVIGISGLFFAYFFLPETKGKTLEQIEVLMTHSSPERI